MNLRNRFTLFVGGIVLSLIVGLVLCIGGLVMIYIANQPESEETKRVPRRPVVFAPATVSANGTAEDGLTIALAQPASIADTKSPNPSVSNTPPRVIVKAVGTPTSGPAVNSVSTATPVANASFTSPVQTPISNPNITVTVTITPTQSNSKDPTATTTSPGEITGPLLVNGSPASSGVKLKLEDKSYNTVAEATIAADGSYTFSNLPPSTDGYTLLFAQEWNSQLDTDTVISWAWLGPIKVDAGSTVQLPNLDIGLQGFEQVSPQPNDTFSASAISAGNPIQFEWSAYPQASKYWVDLVRGQQQTALWQSDSVQSTTLSFDGIINNGQQIEPDEYWWGAGAQRSLGNYTLTVYGYLSVFRVGP